MQLSVATGACFCTPCIPLPQRALLRTHMCVGAVLAAPTRLAVSARVAVAVAQSPEPASERRSPGASLHAESLQPRRPLTTGVHAARLRFITFGEERGNHVEDAVFDRARTVPFEIAHAGRTSADTRGSAVNVRLTWITRSGRWIETNMLPRGTPGSRGDFAIAPEARVHATARGSIHAEGRVSSVEGLVRLR